jgi:hypothetical protein
VRLIEARKQYSHTQTIERPTYAQLASVTRRELALPVHAIATPLAAAKHSVSCFKRDAAERRGDSAPVNAAIRKFHDAQPLRSGGQQRDVVSFEKMSVFSNKKRNVCSNQKRTT